MLNRRTFLSPVLAAFLVTAPLAIMPTPAKAQPPGTGSLTTSIYQVIPNVGAFTGTLTTTGFQVINGVINAVGTISGTLTSSTGAVLGTLTSAPVTLPLTGFTGTCTILTLHIGQINLNVLGLNVMLNPIDLVITATAAPGNLLGNLLCAVAHLLDSNGSLAAVTSLLNQILGAIRL